MDQLINTINSFIDKKTKTTGCWICSSCKRLVPVAAQRDEVVRDRVARLQGTVKQGTPVMMEPWNHDKKVHRGVMIELLVPIKFEA